MDRSSIGVVGAGNWGTTLAKIIDENRQQTLLWSYEPEVADEINAEHCNGRYLPQIKLGAGVRATTSLEEICRCCELLFLTVPSHVFRSVARQMGEHLRGDQVIVHGVKGIEQTSLRRMSEILREETCVREIGVLCGPNLARELAERHPAGAVVASRYDEVVTRAQQILHNGYFRVYGSHDVVGAEVGGAFKNIVALAAGIADGLHLGNNTKALLLARGLGEMSRYGSALGADLITFSGMAGVGDLMATCASPFSRNRQVGERLGRGESLADIEASMYMVAEGIRTTPSVHVYALHHGLDLPIVRGVHAVMYERHSIHEVMDALMARDMRWEFAESR